MLGLGDLLLIYPVARNILQYLERLDVVNLHAALDLQPSRTCALVELLDQRMIALDFLVSSSSSLSLLHLLKTEKLLAYDGRETTPPKFCRLYLSAETLTDPSTRFCRELVGLRTVLFDALGELTTDNLFVAQFHGSYELHVAGLKHVPCELEPAQPRSLGVARFRRREGFCIEGLDLERFATFVTARLRTTFVDDAVIGVSRDAGGDVGGLQIVVTVSLPWVYAVRYSVGLVYEDLDTGDDPVDVRIDVGLLDRRPPQRCLRREELRELQQRDELVPISVWGGCGGECRRRNCGRGHYGCGQHDRGQHGTGQHGTGQHGPGQHGRDQHGHGQHVRSHQQRVLPDGQLFSLSQTNWRSYHNNHQPRDGSLVQFHISWRVNDRTELFIARWLGFLSSRLNATQHQTYYTITSSPSPSPSSASTSTSSVIGSAPKSPSPNPSSAPLMPPPNVSAYTIHPLELRESEDCCPANQPRILRCLQLRRSAHSIDLYPCEK